MPKAIALISGGLDSMLSAKIVMDQGVEVHGVNFYTGFCVEGHTHAIRTRKRNKPGRNNSLWVAEQLGITLEFIDISEDYKDVVLNPKHGYGKNLNPCLDCKIFMVNRLLELESRGSLEFDFVITGEVIGQRPMSQKRERLEIISRESGIEDRLLRPLSAQLLSPTLPERKRWVDRKKLYGFSGRRREPQIQLARKYGFHDFAQPAGGCCFLTDANYASKLSDLWEARGERKYELEDILLLKIGRHIRPAKDFKLIIGRDEGENRFLEGFRRQYAHFRPLSHRGPVVLLDGHDSGENVELAARITARYSQGRTDSQVAVSFTTPDGVSRELRVPPLPEHEVPREWHVGS